MATLVIRSTRIGPNRFTFFEIDGPFMHPPPRIDRVIVRDDLPRRRLPKGIAFTRHAMAIAAAQADRFESSSPSVYLQSEPTCSLAGAAPPWQWTWTRDNDGGFTPFSEMAAIPGLVRPNWRKKG